MKIAELTPLIASASAVWPRFSRSRALAAKDSADGLFFLHKTQFFGVASFERILFLRFFEN